MIRKILLLTLMSVSATTLWAQLAFSGSSLQVIADKPEASTGLNDIYIIYNTSGVTASYTAKGNGNVTFMRYSNLGGGYAEAITARHEGNTYTIDLGADDMGYIVEEGTDRYYCWVVNYANHLCELKGLELADEQDCDRTRLEVLGDASKITYYTITGVGKELSRGMTISYRTLKYNESNEYYDQIEASQTFTSIEHTVGVVAPLCDTRFVLSGDRFLQQWGMAQTVESPEFRATAVEAQTKADQTVRESDNEQKIDGGSLGGSAPAEVTFSAVVTDAAIFREWQMARDSEFEDIYDRFQQLEFTYTFVENGNFFVRFVANNAGGTCEYVGETYEVFIGESDLQCPNAFSPNGDGVNDEWKVTYKSIVKYECHIFNRWGQEMKSMTDPAEGWDGRYGGKYVPTGTYYYVIKAVGSDGRKYNLSGDINILKAKVNQSSQE